MKQRIVLRADGNAAIGYGHFIRSLALAGYLKEDFDCFFTTYNSVEKLPTDYQLQEIAKVCDILPIVGSTLEEANKDFLEELSSCDIVVLDNYYYSTEYQQLIKDKGCKLVCIDDIHDRHMVCDLLITPCPLPSNAFSMEKYTKFRGGIKWAFLREPFLKPNPSRNLTSEISNIVMAMGGTDAFNLTNKMSEIVKSVFPNGSVNIICGETVTVSDNTRKVATIHRSLSAEEIVRLFDSADIGIFPASTVCIEAFSRKLPVIAGWYADNQREFYAYCETNKLFFPLGCLLDDSKEIKKRLLEIIASNRPLPVAIDFKSQRKKIVELFKAI